MAESMEGRRGQNRQRALDQMERLRDQLQMHQFMQDCEELNDWIQEKHIRRQAGQWALAQ